MPQMPPKDIAPRDLFMMATESPRHHRLVDFPRKDAEGNPFCQVAMVVLTQQESTAATLSTERWVRKALKDEGVGIPGSNEKSEGYTTLFENRATMEILVRCCKHPEDPTLTKPFFPGVDALNAKLTTDEIGVLFRAYTIVRSEIGPIYASMSQEEYDAWVEVLSLGGSAYPLASLTLGLQTELLMRMARDLMNSRTSNSSPTKQLDESTAN